MKYFGTGDKRDPDITSRILGHVVQCDGARATIAVEVQPEEKSVASSLSVGLLISIKVGKNRIVAHVFSVKAPDKVWQEDNVNIMHFEVELLGEITEEDGGAKFSAGITKYPPLGTIAHLIRSRDLNTIYGIDVFNPVKIGHLSQNSEIPAYVSADALLNRHFAIVGNTGVGKSSAVSLLLNRIVDECPDLRVLILDPHNEFAFAFKKKARIIDTETLDLPFWIFRLEEFAEVIFRGRQIVPEEIDLLQDLIADAKRCFRGASDLRIVAKRVDRGSFTADTPVPYRIADLLELINERMGRLQSREERPHLRSLKVKINSVITDPRFRFMFSKNNIQDNLTEVISSIFRIPSNGMPITSFQLSGIPSEVVNAVASVLCRMAFEIALWSKGGIRILVLCEEAHRYVPADPKLGFFPTRQAVARIAKEGRKYGVGLGVVTQRPAELDPTILSQCSTMFAMRLANERDQEIVRSSIANSSMSMVNFLSSIGDREAIVFGEAVGFPMRLRIEKISPETLPRTDNALASESFDANSEGAETQLQYIVHNMRHAVKLNENGTEPLQNATLQPELTDLGAIKETSADPETPVESNLPPKPSQPASLIRPEDLRDTLLQRSPHRRMLMKKREDDF